MCMSALNCGKVLTVGASILTHIVLLVIAVIVPDQSSKMPQNGIGSCSGLCLELGPGA